MKKLKKHLAELLTLVMSLSLLSLPQGLVAKAAETTSRAEYFIYFDADNGKLYKETDNFTISDASSWEASASEEYADDSIACSGNRLELHDFYMFPAAGSAAIVTKGNAIIELYGNNEIVYSSQGMPPASSANCGIYSYDDLSITGTGSLEATAGHTAIYVEGNLTTQDATITASAGYFGITVGGNFTINSGSVTGKTEIYYDRPYKPAARTLEWGIHTDGRLEIKGGTMIGDSTTTHATNIHAVSATGGITWNANNTLIVGGVNRGDSDLLQYIHADTPLNVWHFTVKDGDTTTNCAFVQLTTMVTGIKTETPPELDVVIGESTNLDVKVEPETASDQTIIWSTTDDSVVSVDDNGTITAKTDGTATITATTQDGDYKKEFTITVSKADGPAAPTGITAVPPTTIGGSDGKLVGVDTTMEYSTNKDFTDAQDCTGSEVTGLPTGTYYVRVKETDSTKAGADIAVTVPQTGSTGTGSNSNDPSNPGNGTDADNPSSGDGSNPDTSGTTSKSEQSIMDGLGVSADTAKQILDEAAKLGVSEDTLLITDASIKSQTSDADIKGSSFGLLKARATSLKKKSITIKWSKVKNADGYIIYGNKCGAKNSYKKIKTIKKNTTCKLTQKKLKKGTYYKYLVVAYKKIAGTTVTIAASKTIHATTKGGKYGVAKSVKVNKTKKTLAVSKTFKIKASEVKQDKTIRQHRKIKYESSNTKIATVTNKGVVKAKKKGKCYIYVYAQNGVYKKITITVK